MKKKNVLKIAEKAIIIGLSLNVAYLLFAVVFRAVTEVICNMVNPYNICAVLLALLMWQAYLIVKQGVPGVPGDEERKASDLRAIQAADSHKIKKEL